MELLSGVVSRKIAMQGNEEEVSYTNYLKSIRAKPGSQIYNHNYYVKGLLSGDDAIADLLQTENLVVIDDKKLTTKLQVPGKTTVDNILMWVQGFDIINDFYVINLSEVYDAGSQITEGYQWHDCFARQSRKGNLYPRIQAGSDPGC